MENNVIVECEPIKDVELYIISLHIRLATGHKLNEHFDVLNALEFTLPKYFRVDSVYTVIEDENWQHGNIPAVSVPKFMHIEIRQSVYDRAVDNDKDAIKAITHEVVHLFMDLFYTVKNIYRSTKNRKEAGIPEECSVESFVEKVTSMVLCPPEQLLENSYSVEDLLKSCNISPETLSEAERLSESVKIACDRKEVSMDKALSLLLTYVRRLEMRKSANKKLFSEKQA